MSDARAFPWRAEFGRKGIHLSSAVYPLAWAFDVVDRRQLCIILAVLFAGAVVIELLRRSVDPVRRWFDAWFGWMLRPHESSAPTGATWFLGAMLLCALVLPERAAIAALWAGVFGDAAAALIGRAVAARAAAKGKTWAGSAACAIASAVGPVLLVAATPLQAIGIGIAAMLAERPRLALDDNARVAVAAGLAAWGLGVL